MSLDDRQLKAIKYIVQGENITNVAKLVDVNRNTIYLWLNKTEFKAEVDKQTSEVRKQVTKKITSRLDSVVEQVLKIALKSKSETNRLEASKYLMDHALGKATTKTLELTAKEEDKEPNEDIEEIIEDVDNVVEIKQAK